MVKVILSSLIILMVILLVVAYLTWFERKFASRLQRRVGPYWVGYPHGWLQPIADALKIMQKEDIVPREADKFLFNTAPFIFFVIPLLSFAAIPFTKTLVISDLECGAIYVLALSSLLVFGVVFAAWGSNNKYAMLSGMRYISQMISYEVPLVLSIMVPVVLAGSLNLREIVEAQRIPYFLFPVVGQVSFVIFLLSTLAEGNRTPFDIPEAESELVGGFNIEYSGWKFAMFYVGEYAHLFFVCVLGSILFLGGWKGPILPGWLWLLIKSIFMFALILWIRWSYVRLRVDQLMRFNWKVLIPVSLLNLLISGLIPTIGV